MTLGFINNCFLEFLYSRFSAATVDSILRKSGLRSDATWIGSCPYVDGELYRSVSSLSVAGKGTGWPMWPHGGGECESQLGGRR